MKTKQAHLIAKFTAQEENARNMAQDKETVSQYKIIDKKTESVIIDCRVYMGRSASASTVYSSIWIHIPEANKPEGWQYGYTTGRGSASGYGYHKESQAIADALASAGVKLYGSPYPTDKASDKRKPAYIGGTGCHKEALLAVAYAAGCKDAILVDC